MEKFIVFFVVPLLAWILIFISPFNKKEIYKGKYLFLALLLNIGFMYYFNKYYLSTLFVSMFLNAIIAYLIIFIIIMLLSSVGKKENETSAVPSVLYTVATVVYFIFSFFFIY